MLKTLKSAVPKPLKRLYWRMLWKYRGKYTAELAYWKWRFQEEGGCIRNELPGNHHFATYERLFLAMAGEPDQEFLRDKIVADFGCGPRGSLTWAVAARARIGIDVLADRYAAEFGIRAHNMVYVTATEKSIPLPSDYADVVFSLNALDHTDNFPRMCREVLRVLAPGGLLIASLNLEEPATKCEPQTLTETAVRDYLLRGLQITSYRIAIKGRYPMQYEDMVAGKTVPRAPKGVPSVLWVRAVKPGTSM